MNFTLIDKQINFRCVLTNSRTNDRAKRSGATPRTQSTGTVPCCLNYIRKTYIIDVEKEEDYSTRDEHGRFTGSVPRGGGSGGGGSGAVTNAAGRTVRVVNHIELKGEPNSITQKKNAGGGLDRNYYGADGKQTKQISNHDHGHPKQHPYGNHGEHTHDYIWDDNGNLIGRTTRELNDQERKDEGDML